MRGSHLGINDEENLPDGAALESLLSTEETEDGNFVRSNPKSQDWKLLAWANEEA